jgi:hypothetical protein
MVAGKLLQHHFTLSAASVAQSTASHMMAGARRSLHVTRHRRSAGRARPACMGQGVRWMVADELLQHHCTLFATRAAQNAARHMKAGARLSMHVTRR